MDAIPPILLGDLVRDAKDVHRNDAKHYGLLTNLSAPIGIIPVVYNIRSTENAHIFEFYQSLHKGMMDGMRSIDQELKIAQEKSANRN